MLNYRKQKPRNSSLNFRRTHFFRKQKPTFGKRVLNLLLNPWLIGLICIIFVSLFLIATYFWFEYSAKIDLLLSGEIFTRNAGIYAAPKILRHGENISLDDLVSYLKSAGYIQKSDKTNPSRSRYQIQENSLLIEPGETALIDGEKIFPPLLVKFTKDGKKIDSITDLNLGKTVKRAKLEPRILSSLAGENEGRRKAVGFNDLPNHLIKAIIVTEDRAFFEHRGINFRGILRALWRRYEGNEDSPIAYQGGSSITQQLVKNLFLTPERSIKRKLQEAYMSVILETRLTKEEIFTLYVNQIYLGQQAGVSIYGVGEASKAYFGKDVSQLNLAESAFIAGLIRSPNRYNPYRNPEKATERRNQVLISMLEAGEIKPEEFELAKLTPLNVIPPNRPELRDLPYFTQYVIEEIPKYVNDPEAVQHLRIYTTLDVDLQKAAYQAVTKRLERLQKYFPKRKDQLQAALIALDPKTGDVLAMVGGKDFFENQFNRATNAMRQPGSVFKPIVYAAAINTAYDQTSRIFTAASVFKDEKKVFTYGRETYSPSNFGDVFTNKEMTLRDALVKSKNVITVELAMELNVGKVMNLAHRFGLPKVEKAYPSMALGTAEATPLQVATAYTVFANLGDRVSPKPVSTITTGEGKTVSKPTPDKRNILRPDVIYIVNDMLKDVINRGTAASAQAWGFRNAPGRAYAGKTGTSRDGWFAGFTPNLVCVVYVGFDDGSDLNMKGADSALPIWADFMKSALELYPEWNGDWQMPDTIVKAEIDIRNGKVLRELSNPDEITNTQSKPENEVQQSDSRQQTNLNQQNGLESQRSENADAGNLSDEVPPEFRRIELFIRGTLPVKSKEYKEVEEYKENEISPESENYESVQNAPEASPVPTSTSVLPWVEEKDNKSGQKEPTSDKTPISFKILISVCPSSGLKATPKCPSKELREFNKGEEPKEFCYIHSP
jgi:penicillin-binding protein 1B